MNQMNATQEQETWTISSNNVAAKGEVNYPANELNPSILEIVESPTQNITASLIYNKAVKKGDTIKITYMYERNENPFYIDFYACGQGITGDHLGGTLLYSKAGQTRTNEITVQENSNNMEIKVIRTNCPNETFWTKIYIYEILLNGEKIL